ncbi:ABC transporter permease [Allorhizobium undicola]|uniref:ABC transporter permease n=1 Tax=Allorhizobium undicola TaxID=78527 RepID=UPI000685A264|nr:ABC transporter permease [Allorhizobium undicola]
MTLLIPSPPQPRFWTISRLAGVAILAAMLVFAFAPLVASGADPYRQTLRLALQPPGAADLFGYDHLGRSMHARLAAALRLSLGLALLSALTAMVPGTLLGILAAWRGGLTDRAFSLLAEAMLALPGLLMVLMLTAILPGEPAMLYLGISLVLWVEFFRLARALARPVLSSSAVEAARLLGFGPWHLLSRHLWPAMAPMMLTVTAYSTATAIMAIAALGFVSVGVRPPTPELGAMMIELLPYYEEAPHALLQPIAGIFLMVLSLQLIAGKERP